MQLKTKAGFTLVELLVVIVIIAVLASVGFAVGPKMLRKADAAKSVHNLRQMTPLMIGYTAENSGRLPPLRGTVVDDSGTQSEQIWHEALLKELYPDATLRDFKREQWWKAQEPIIRNPLLKKGSKPRGWTPTNPGYAMNQRIFDNLDRDLDQQIPLASIPEPARTPLVAPFYDNAYTYMGPQIAGEGLKNLMTEGKVPILFLDGHVEVMEPREYERRELYDFPEPRR